MFSHIMVGANDVPAAKRFYDAMLGELGIKPGNMDSPERCSFIGKSGAFMVKQPIDGEPATHGNGSTIGFVAESSEAAKAAHGAGVANGGVSCEDPPGLRDSGVYLAYLRDPAGNKICIAHRPR